MKFIGKTCSSPNFSEVAYLDGAQKPGLKYALGIDNKGKRSWSSFFIRHDFGVIAQDHEVVNLPLFIRMG